MRANPLVSILINNFNYGRFLAQVVDGALAQTYRHVEVIVVDDGSTDNSLLVLERYHGRVNVIAKPKGGQASAMNVGFAQSRGSIVHFLDADDLVFPQAIEQAVAAFADPRVVKVHWPLALIDESGAPTGGVKYADPLAAGDLSPLLSQDCIEHLTPPQSGNAWTRAFLEQVLPLEETLYRTGGADTFLSLMTLPFGQLAALPAPQGAYRQHAASGWTGASLVDRLPVGVRRFAYACERLADACRTRGIDADPSAWVRTSWLNRLNEFVQLVCRAVPEGETFILVDEERYGIPATLGGRRRRWLTERNDAYNGLPGDSADAIAALEELRRHGASIILFPSSSFWWLEHYAEFERYLSRRFARVIANDQVIAYHLGRPAA